VKLPHGVLLDLDDTLFREYDYVMSGYTAVSRQLEIDGMTPEKAFERLREIFETPDRARAFDALLEPAGQAHLIVDAIAIYRDHEPAISLLDGAAAILRALAETHRLAIVTDGPACMQRRKVDALGLEAQMPVVISDEIAGRASWKPSPLPYEAAAGALGLATADCVYVGDNPHKDFMGARRAGMSSIRFRAPWQIHAQCKPADAEAAPDDEIKRLADLLT
jgi:putative hydrolase of the HAD superfamily